MSHSIINWCSLFKLGKLSVHQKMPIYIPITMKQSLATGKTIYQTGFFFKYITKIPFLNTNEEIVYHRFFFYFCTFVSTVKQADHSLENTDWHWVFTP
jgi:hypothetical protein